MQTHCLMEYRQQLFTLSRFENVVLKESLVKYKQ